ncbi:hypothetical protein LEN26_000065 [Aphanomyces euteiches]|nr:hypothetical protein AeMF1_015725 [Aphanomyces euteiches]KAH9164430.1 hypothetical protein LEN26_000065 [Aphanomyces euteiches]
MAPSYSRFVHRECALPLFSEAYTRNNKSTGHKNLRCFPHCCGAHRPNSFCGTSVVVEFAANPDTPRDAFVSYCRFEPADGSEAIHNEIEMSALAADLRSSDLPLGAWMSGEKLNHISDYPAFEFNRNRQSWHYAWRSNRFNCNIRHQLVAYLFVHDTSTNVLHCVERLPSPPFTVGSSRRSATKQSSPVASGDLSNGSDEDDATNSAANAQDAQMALYEALTLSQRDKMMECAKYEMLELIEIYSRCSTNLNDLNALNVPRTSPTYALLVELLNQHILTPWTMDLVLSQAHDNLHSSFRQLLWELWKMLSYAQEARRLTVAEIITDVLSHCPSTQLSHAEDNWYAMYVSLVQELQKAAARVPSVGIGSPSDKSICGRWYRESPVTTQGLVTQQFLDRGSRVWVCQRCPHITNTIQMQWESSVFPSSTLFQLDRFPQHQPHELLGPGGFPTLGSHMHLCGTRAWEENQGDTLVVEWYFWPAIENRPRKRVRERFTLLASTTSSLMYQQFVELCWDVQQHHSGDPLQLMLLPASWQVHHIETSYYRRIA